MTFDDDGARALDILKALSKAGQFTHIQGPTHEGLQGNHLYVNGRVPLTPRQNDLIARLKA